MPNDTGRARAAKAKHTRAAQQFINAKNCADRLQLLLYANFDNQRACFVTFTYDDKHLPANKKAASRNAKRFFAEIRIEKKKQGEAFPYIYTTEGQPLSVSPSAADVCGSLWEVRPWDCAEKWESVGDKDSAALLDETRLHHHAIMLLSKKDYDIIRANWPYGHVYIEKIKISDFFSFECLAYYMTKESRAGKTGNGQRAYVPSVGLVKPTITGEWVEEYQDIQPPKGAKVICDTREENLFSSYHHCSFLLPRQSAPPKEYKPRQRSTASSGRKPMRQPVRRNN
jgi:hypothetical protein